MALLRRERERLTRQIAAVASTIEALRGGEQLMAQDMFDGFDHTQYESEVVERWGPDAYAQSDTWWRGLDADERAQQLAARHVAWLTGVPGAPTAPGQLKGYVTGLSEMYAAGARSDPGYAKGPGAMRAGPLFGVGLRPSCCR